MRGCAELSPSPEWTGTPVHPLDSEQKLQIANVLINADLVSKRGRAITQLQVWCISDTWAEGSVNIDALEYFNRYDFRGATSSDDPETRALSDDEARCNYLPDLAQTPTLTLTGPSDQLPADTPAQFTLTTNVTTPITLSSTGASALQLCPAEPTRVICRRQRNSICCGTGIPTVRSSLTTSKVPRFGSSRPRTLASSGRGLSR